MSKCDCPRCGKPEYVVDQFREWAFQAVEDWDGQDNRELFDLLRQRLGIGWLDIMEIASKEFNAECIQYAAKPEPDPAITRVPYCGTCGCHHYPGNCPGDCMKEFDD